MTRTALLAVPLLVVLLAGCSGSGGQTAQSLRSVADGSAAAWDPDAFLVSAIGIEANITIPPEARAALQQQAKEHAAADPEAILTLMSDPRVGDGIAPGWAFAYASSRGIYVVAIGADRSVVYSEVINMTDEEREMVGSEIEAKRTIIEDGIAAWSVDSAQAAESLAAANATFAEAVGKPEQIAVWVLNPTDRTWEMVLSPAKGQGLRMHATISYEDATVRSGKVFGLPKVQVPVNPDVTPKEPVEKQVDQEAGEVSGSVSLLSTTDEGSFSIKDKHDEGTLLIRAQDQFPGVGTVTVNVRSPSGEEYVADLSSGLGDEVTIPFDSEVGQWSVLMSSSGVSAGTNVDVLWCTDGEPTGSTARNDDCMAYLFIGPSGPPADTVYRGPFSRWLPF